MRIGDFEIPGELPEFKEPHVLAVLRPWIDVGNAGLDAFTTLPDTGPALISNTANGATPFLTR